MFSRFFGGGSGNTGDNNNNNDNGDKDKQDNNTVGADILAGRLKNNGSDKSKSESFMGFDPSAIERVLKALKELNEMPNADEGFKISKERERTMQLEAQKAIEENKARAEAFASERIRLEQEEKRKTEQQNAYYNDQLARKRNQDQLQAQASMKAQEMKRQEETQKRIEQLRRETAQYEASLRKETEKARAEAESLGRARQERENFDLRIQQSKLEAQEFRETVLKGIQETGIILGKGARDFFTDYQKIGTTIGGLSLLALGIYSARTTTTVAGRLIEARLGKPPLVRETNRTSLLSALRSPMKTIGQRFSAKTSPLDGIVLEPRLHSRLEQISRATVNTKKNKAPYRHMLLYGPPGTGKTLYARQLAQASGMDYAILTGGDVAPLGRDAVTELHKLFDWAQTSRKGVILFVDESDAFLRKRTNETMSEDLRNALNAFLYRTGTESNKFQVVFASNQPDQLDSAILDRADEAILFNLPQEDERYRMIQQYFDRYVKHNPKGAVKIKVDESIDDDALRQVAKLTKGFSGREIVKLCIAWQSAGYGTDDATITQEIFDRIVEERIQQHIQKHKWHVGQELGEVWEEDEQQQQAKTSNNKQLK